MDQLSGADNVSLFAERGNVYNHVGVMLIYDVTTAPGGAVRFKDILQHFEERLYLHPVFRRHLATAPFALDRPYLVADTLIDVEYHIRHIALPEPGDWRQLMIQVARLHSRPLDRTRPLWEVYVIEGLDNIPNLPKGAFAIFLKIHHAVVDGMAAVHLLTQLHTQTPEQLHPVNIRPTIVGEYNPSTYELLTRSVANSVGRIGKLARLSASSALKLLAAGRKQLGHLDEMDAGSITNMLKGLLPPRAPHTRFSEKVSGNRVMEGFGMPLSRIKRIRNKVPGSTLNDIFISVAAGAVRKYLERKGELPEESLTSLMPISLRTDASSGGNDVGGIPVSVCSNIADPIERLKAVHHATKESKTRAEKVGLDVLKNLFEVLPSMLVNVLLNNLILPTINMTTSNVRGPDKPIYLAGAKAMCMYPVSIPADGGGLNFTGISYNGVMWVSMVSCRKMLPDPGLMLACMNESWSELLIAADQLPDPAAQAAKKPVRKRRTVSTAA
ncbi:wax ester/triacylglycerol synthase family O-acyltransferase [Pseudomonas sp. N040]|uniref:wax ester/triacylglycerol synthase family O-acyltransferase n=1 Tax=Pseudomonas sp. N040 TaxID=2785325 RepID=UPI0018A2C05B|nr:wax ester/triacylglycerol synthase family O-acyltransferase [Pseudomonas sp. N040]MBF7731214.1 wax ester/triacylglycerol synthase family O-acyltransferase [Pseudomonas sp. N040]MBW7014857.1 wax ester/triacylglycerol synthase family O-acyltransferase [Pseudomonas sp. N040]